jgi:hypothetical protein
VYENQTQGDRRCKKEAECNLLGGFLMETWSWAAAIPVNPIIWIRRRGAYIEARIKVTSFKILSTWIFSN